MTTETRIAKKLYSSPNGRYTTRSLAEEKAARALIADGRAVLKRSYPVTSMRPRRHVYRALELHVPAPNDDEAMAWFPRSEEDQIAWECRPE